MCAFMCDVQQLKNWKLTNTYTVKNDKQFGFDFTFNNLYTLTQSIPKETI